MDGLAEIGGAVHDFEGGDAGSDREGPLGGLIEIDGPDASTGGEERHAAGGGWDGSAGTDGDRAGEQAGSERKSGVSNKCSGSEIGLGAFALERVGEAFGEADGGEPDTVTDEVGKADGFW